MSRVSSSYRPISAAGPRPTSAANPPAVDDAVDQRDRQTDGRTDARSLHRPCSAYHTDCVKMSGTDRQTDRRTLDRIMTLAGRYADHVITQP